MAAGKGPTVTLTFAGDSKKLDSTMDKVGRKTKGVGSTVKDNLALISGASVAAGAGLEAFARSQADSNLALADTATRTGMTEDALRDLAGEMSGFSGSSADLAAGMDTLSQSGISTREEFEKILPPLDELATATGQTLPDSIGQMESLLGPLGTELDEAGKYTDTFTDLVKNAGVPVDSLGRNLARVPDELQALGFDLDDTAAGVKAFTDRGFEGKEAVREFRRAVDESDGDMETFLQKIGMSADEWQRYKDEAGPAAGITKDFADNADAAETPLERLQGFVEDLQFKFGGWTDAVGLVALGLFALGPIIQGAMGLYKLLALRAMWTGLTMFAAWVIGLGPIGLVILAVIAVVAVFVYLWNNVEGFRQFFIDAWENIKWALGAAWDWIQGKAESVVGFFQSLPGRIGGIFRSVGSAITGAFRSAFNAVAGLWNSTIGALSWTVPGWVPLIGGSTISAPKLPTYHQGGRVRGAPGEEVLALLQAGERVTPAGQAAREDRGGAATVAFSGNVDSAFATAFMKLVRTGEIQVVTS